MKIKKLFQLGSALLVALYSLLAINLGQAFAVASNCSWTGAGDGTSFSDATNWTSCNSTAPQNGDNIIIDAANITNGATLNNNITNLSVNNITSSGTNATGGIVHINGNALTVTGDIANSSTVDDFFFGAPLTFSGVNHNINTTGGQTIRFLSNLSGGSSAKLTIVGGLEVFFLGDNSSYQGNIEVTSGAMLDADTATALGDATGSTTIDAGGSLFLLQSSNQALSLAEPLTLAGDGSGNDQSFNNFAVGGNGGITLTGAINLTGDTRINPDTGNNRTGKLTITGAISGSHSMGVSDGGYGSLILNSSTNSSLTANGTYIAPQVTQTISGTWNTDLGIGFNETYVIDGTDSSPVVVGDGGTLKGTGSITNTTVVQSGAIIAPGHSPGCLNTGDLEIAGTYQAEIGGTTACTSYDQINVTGTVDVTGGTLAVSLYNGYQPKAGETYTIINNDGSDAVTGTFTGLPEGATFNVGSDVFQITYKGGTGNDVVLTVKSVPATTPTTPNTGFGLITANPLIGLTGATLMASGFYGLSKKTKALRRR